MNFRLWLAVENFRITISGLRGLRVVIIQLEPFLRPEQYDLKVTRFVDMSKRHFGFKQRRLRDLFNGHEIFINKYIE